MAYDPMDELVDEMEKIGDSGEMHYSDGLDQIIRRYFDINKISSARLSEMEKVKGCVYNAIYQKLGRAFTLDAFGSSVSGFGTNQSYLDLCFRFTEEKGYEKNSHNQYETIQLIASALRDAGFLQVMPITTAKVPIVKFIIQVESGEIEGDISYYNELALHSTRLLKIYCSWTCKEDMLPKLGLFLKRWAQVCDIGDVWRGSMSSYACMILLVHFLQRAKPHPLLPVLQEMGDKQVIEVNGCDVYFCDDEPDPHWSECTLSEGELFLQFLEYYSKFDFHNEVVQIRQLHALARLYPKREWFEDEDVIIPRMCIQDPFDQRNNVGAAIRYHMYLFITKAFATSHKIFSDDREKSRTMNRFNDLVEGRTADRRTRMDRLSQQHMDALLAECRCSIGETPRYRRCNNCGHVGHPTRYCTH